MFWKNKSDPDMQTGSRGFNVMADECIYTSVAAICGGFLEKLFNIERENCLFFSEAESLNDTFTELCNWGLLSKNHKFLQDTDTIFRINPVLSYKNAMGIGNVWCVCSKACLSGMLVIDIMQCISLNMCLFPIK